MTCVVQFLEQKVAGSPRWQQQKLLNGNSEGGCLWPHLAQLTARVCTPATWQQLVLNSWLDNNNRASSVQWQRLLQQPSHQTRAASIQANHEWRQMGLYRGAHYPEQAQRCHDRQARGEHQGDTHVHIPTASISEGRRQGAIRDWHEPRTNISLGWKLERTVMAMRKAG